MLTAVRALPLVLSSLCLSGCMFQNLTAQNRFTDHVFVLNDAARWGRVDVAMGTVHADYRERYVQRHQHWGESVQIAESSVVRMQLDDEKETATSQVKVSWYSKDTLTLRSSTILQRWQADGQKFKLVGEEIAGDTSLFADEAETRSEPSAARATEVGQAPSLETASGAG